jgi:hypothetical protein
LGGRHTLTSAQLFCARSQGSYNVRAVLGPFLSPPPGR